MEEKHGVPVRKGRRDSPEKVFQTAVFFSGPMRTEIQVVPRSFTWQEQAWPFTIACKSQEKHTYIYI